MTIFTPEVQSAISALGQASQEIKAELVERDEVVDLALMSLVAEQNIFLCGLPGVAKSMVFDLLFSRIGGARQGFYVLTKGSTPETLVGPMSVRALKEQDTFRYNTTGMLPDVHLAYIDEVFKGNALTRNAAMNILNEKVFFNGGTPQRCPLISCAAASNEYPDAKEDAAFFDRFLVRMQVEPIQAHANRLRMIRSGLARQAYTSAPAAITLDQLQLLHQARREVRLPDTLEDLDLAMTNALKSLGADAALGDRRAQRSYVLAQARALLQGREEITADDLIVFTHTAWANPDARKAVQQAVLRAIAPEIADVTRLYDEIETGYETFLKELDEAAGSNDTMRKMSANKRFGDAAQGNLDQIRRIVAELRSENRDATQAIELGRRAAARIEDAIRMTITNRRERDPLEAL